MLFKMNRHYQPVIPRLLKRSANRARDPLAYEAGQLSELEFLGFRE